MILKKHKSISWKAAIGVVVFLHLAVYGAITQYSSYKKKMAEQMRDRKEKLYAEKESKPEWNNNHVKPRVVAVPVPKVSKKENTSTENKAKDLITNSVNSLNESLVSLNGIKNTFQSEIKKIENPFAKKEVKSSSVKLVVKEKSHVTPPSKPVVKSTPKPKLPQTKPVIVNTVPPKPIIKNSYIPITPQSPKVTQIPTTPEPSREIKVRNIIIESDGSIVETTEETRRVISSQVVLR